MRLAQGDYDTATVFEAEPAAAARRFAAAGAPRVHVVDLDGARAGEPRNLEAVRAVVAAAGGVPVQLGGGLRRLADLERALALGVGRVVLGTAALRDPALVREGARRFPGRVAVGIDARSGQVAVEGWLTTSEARAEDIARAFEDAGVAALIYTDIARDGMGSGPDLEGAARLAEAVAIPVIASGGVGSLDHVRRAAGYAARGVAGLIVGRALYTGAVELDAALRVAAGVERAPEAPPCS